jgi:hypothetical protein
MRTFGAPVLSLFQKERSLIWTEITAFSAKTGVAVGATSAAGIETTSTDNATISVATTFDRC